MGSHRGARQWLMPGQAEGALFERAALPRVLPFFAYLLFIALGDLLARLGWSAAELRWLYPLKIAVVLALLLFFRKEYLELGRPSLSSGAIATALGVGVVVLVLWLNLGANWMVLGASSGFDPRIDGKMDWPLALVRLAGAALVVPVMEELFWRSFLLRWLHTSAFIEFDPGDVKCKSFVVTVILFGIEHNLWLAGMVAGTAYTILYMRSRTLWSPILAHGVTNGLLGIWIIATGQWTYW
jgi:CAAX prenyl protease-like protein